MKIKSRKKCHARLPFTEQELTEYAKFVLNDPSGQAERAEFGNLMRSHPSGGAGDILLRLAMGAPAEKIARVSPYLAPLIPAVERFYHRFIMDDGT